MPAPDNKKGLDGVLRQLLMRRAKVVAVQTVAERFRLITLGGRALRGVAWRPGQKLQIAMDHAFITRTYTPVEWNGAAGLTRILCDTRPGGPGSIWARDLRPGDECDLFGPRHSSEPAATDAPLAIFGDETSIGLAAALATTRMGSCWFEFEDVAAGGAALDRLDLSGAAIFARRRDEAHLEEMQTALAKLAGGGAQFVLTGRAAAVQTLRQALKRLNVPTSRITTKAYWAPGKVGLD